MTVEEYFEEWWTPKKLPENGFNKTAMLDFAEMYHNQALRTPDVVGRREQLAAFYQWMCDNDVQPCDNCKDSDIDRYLIR